MGKLAEKLDYDAERAEDKLDEVSLKAQAKAKEISNAEKDVIHKAKVKVDKKIDKIHKKLDA